MGPQGKGRETWQVSSCLVQNIISQPAVPSPGSAGMALDYQHQPWDGHRATFQLSLGPLHHVLAPAR